MFGPVTASKATVIYTEEKVDTMNYKATVVTFGLLVTAILAAGENLFPNPEFKSANGKSPDGWYAHQEAPRKLIPFSMADGIAKISQHSDSRLNQLIVSVKTGNMKKLHFSIEYKLDSLASDGGVLFHFVDSSGKRMNESVPILFTKTAIPEWSEFSQEIAVPEGAAKITFTLAVYGDSKYPDASFQFRRPVLENISEEPKK